MLYKYETLIYHVRMCVTIIDIRCSNPLQKKKKKRSMRYYYYILSYRTIRLQPHHEACDPGLFL